MKKPLYEVEVIASADGGNSFYPVKVLTLDNCYEENDYQGLEPVGYIEVVENSQTVKELEKIV